MDLWGITWTALALVLFPFGYKPMLFLLVMSSIFQGSSALSMGALNIPLSPFVECLFVARLCLPMEGKGFVNLKNKKILVAILWIVIIWIYTYFSANLFSGLRVYSSLQSFESNFVTHGMPLRWSGANLNQLVILSTHILTLSLIYYRREDIDKSYFLNCILFTLVVFIGICIVWKIFPAVYTALSLLIFNNTSYSVTSLYEARVSGTFVEPSLAGLYICTFAVPLLCAKKKVYKILGLGCIFVFALNLSTSGLFTLVISAPIVFIILFRKTIQNYFLCALVSITMTLAIIPVINLFSKYAEQKSSSDSGVMRGAANLNAFENIFNSYGFGLGVGSERASSLLITIINNFGIGIGLIFALYGYRLLKNRNKNSDANQLLITLFTVSFFGSFSANPEYTLAFMWILLYACIVKGGELDVVAEKKSY